MHQGDQAPSPATGTTFSFRRRWAQIDWRSLASIDVDRIAHEMDVKTLQQNIMNITFCNALSEEFHNVDPNFMKLFRLSQLTIEYLLFTQQYLSDQIASFDGKTDKVQHELSEVKGELEVKQKELVIVKKENRKRRKIIEKYQKMLHAGATGLHPCPVCRREFISSEYLQGHIARRHPNHLPIKSAPILVESAPPIPERVEPPRIDQEEIKTQLMQQLNERLLQSEVHIKQSLTAKEFKTIEDKLKDLAMERQQEQQQAKVELQEHRSSLLNELHQHKQETEKLQEALQNAQAELARLKESKPSLPIQGAEEVDSLGKKAKEEVGEMRNQMQIQMNSMKSKLKKQKEMMKEKLGKLSDNHHKHLLEYAERLTALEETCQSSLASTGRDFKENVQILQQKLLDQERLMSEYEREIKELKSTATSPVKGIAELPQLSTDYSLSGDDLLSYSIEEEEYTEHTDDDVFDEPVKHYTFTPFQHRPYITSNFNHNAAQLEKIRQAMVGAVNERMKKRGLGNSIVGLSNDDYEEKLRLLEHDRRTRLKTQQDFHEHRDQLVQQVDEVVSRTYEPPEVPVSLYQPAKEHALHPVTPTKTPLRQANSPVVLRGIRQSVSPSLPRKIFKEPAVASPVLKRNNTKQPTSPATPKEQREPTTSEPPPILSTKPVTTPPVTPKRSVNATPNKQVTIITSTLSKKPPVHNKTVKTAEMEDSLTELTTEDCSTSLELVPVTSNKRKGAKPRSETRPPSTSKENVKPLVPVTGKDPTGVDHTHSPLPPQPKKNSSWDSTTDEEDISDPASANIMSSTPIKPPSRGLDPSKRPPGGVPVMIAINPPSEMDSNDSDTFTLSDHAPPPPHHKAVRLEDIPTIGGGSTVTAANNVSQSPSTPIPQGISKTSALTTVSSIHNDDFNMSDISDLELT